MHGFGMMYTHDSHREQKFKEEFFIKVYATQFYNFYIKVLIKEIKRFFIEYRLYRTLLNVVKEDCNDYKKRMKKYKRENRAFKFKKRIEKLVNYLLYKL